MKTIFDSATALALINRINALSAQSKPNWGTMDVFQMVRHCSLCEDMMQGEIQIKRVFIGRLIGPALLKKVLKDDRPFAKNSPTSPLLKTTSAQGDLVSEVEIWIQKIKAYEHFENDLLHPFFGKMSNEQIGQFVYKHADHHLRQFGV